MDLTERIWISAARGGQILAVLAALFLVVNPHATHAGADHQAGHDHSDHLCDSPDGGCSPADDGGAQDCFHPNCANNFETVFTAHVGHSPLALTPSVQITSEQSVLPYGDVSDPPPPRTPS